MSPSVQHSSNSLCNFKKKAEILRCEQIFQQLLGIDFKFENKSIGDINTSNTSQETKNINQHQEIDINLHNPKQTVKSDSKSNQPENENKNKNQNGPGSRIQDTSDLVKSFEQNELDINRQKNLKQQIIEADATIDKLAPPAYGSWNKKDKKSETQLNPEFTDLSHSFVTTSCSTTNHGTKSSLPVQKLPILSQNSVPSSFYPQNTEFNMLQTLPGAMRSKSSGKINRTSPYELEVNKRCKSTSPINQSQNATAKFGSSNLVFTTPSKNSSGLNSSLFINPPLTFNTLNSSSIV